MPGLTDPRSPLTGACGQWFHASLPGRGEASFFVSPELGGEPQAHFERAVQVTGARGQVREGELDRALSCFAWRTPDRPTTWMQAVVHVEFRARDFAGRPGSLTGHGLAFAVEEERLATFDPFVLWRAELDPADRRALERTHWLARREDVERLDADGPPPSLPTTSLPRRPWLAGRVARLAQRFGPYVDAELFERLLTAWSIALLPNQAPVLLVVDPLCDDPLPLLEALHLAMPEPERPLASFTSWRLDVPRDPLEARYPFRFTLLPHDRHVADRVLSRKDVREHYRVFLLAAQGPNALRELEGPAVPTEARDAARSYARLVTPSFFPNRGVPPARTLQRVQGWARRLLRDRRRFGDRLGPYCRGPLARFVRLHELERGGAEGDDVPTSDGASRAAAMARAMSSLSPARAMGFYARAVWDRLRTEDFERAVTFLVEAARGAERAGCLERPVFPLPGEGGPPRTFDEFVEHVAPRLPVVSGLRLVRRLVPQPPADGEVLPDVALRVLERSFPVGGSARARVYARLLDDAELAAEVLGDGEGPGFHAIDRRFLRNAGGCDVRAIDRQACASAVRHLAHDPERVGSFLATFRTDLIEARAAGRRDAASVEDWRRLLRGHAAVPLAPGRSQATLDALREPALDEDALVRLADDLQGFPLDGDAEGSSLERMANHAAAIAADERRLPRLLQRILERYAARLRAREAGAEDWSAFLDVVVPRLALVPEERARRALATAVVHALECSAAWLSWLRWIGSLPYEDVTAVLDALGRTRFDVALESAVRAEAAQGIAQAVGGGLQHLLRHDGCRAQALRAVAKLCRDDPESGVFAGALESLEDREGDHETTLRRLAALAHLFDARRLTAGRFLAAITDFERLDARGFDAARRLDLYTPPERIGRAVLESRHGPRALERILADLDEVQIAEAEKTRLDLVAGLFGSCLRSGTARRRLLPLLARSLGTDLDDIVARGSWHRQDPWRFAEVLTRALRWTRPEGGDVEVWAAHLQRAFERTAELEGDAFQRASRLSRILVQARRHPELQRRLAGSIDRLRDALLAVDDERRRHALLPEVAEGLVLAGCPGEVWTLFHDALPRERRTRTRALPEAIDAALQRLRIPELLERHVGFAEHFLRAARAQDDGFGDLLLERLFWLDLERTDGRLPGTHALLAEIHGGRVDDARFLDLFEALLVRHPLRALSFYLALPDLARTSRALRRRLRAQWDVVRALHPPPVVELAAWLDLHAEEGRHQGLLVERAEELVADGGPDVRRCAGVERLKDGLRRLARAAGDPRIAWRALRLLLAWCEDEDEYLELLEALPAAPWETERREEVTASLAPEALFARVAGSSEEEACAFTRRALALLAGAPPWVRTAWLEALWDRLPAGRNPVAWVGEEIARLARTSTTFAERLLARDAFAGDPAGTRRFLEELGGGSE